MGPGNKRVRSSTRMPARGLFRIIAAPLSRSLSREATAVELKLSRAVTLLAEFNSTATQTLFSGRPMVALG